MLNPNMDYINRLEDIMLEKIDLAKKITKEEYKELMPKLELRLGQVQRKARELAIPVMIVFEGWDASGKGTLINQLILSLDPRGLNVYPIGKPNEEERMRPFLHRFWVKTPSRGRIAIYEKSWYQGMLGEGLLNSFAEINSFERMLVDDGTIIIKLFLHISQKEQKKRFADLKKNPGSGWLVLKKDFDQNKNYNEYLSLVEEMLQKTDTKAAPWAVVEAQDKRFAELKAFTSIIRAIEVKIREIEDKKKEENKNFLPVLELNSIKSSILDKVDLSKSLDQEQYRQQLKKYQDHLREIEYQLYLKRRPMIIVYEGWDASGKGGNIRRLTKNLDPRGYQVVPVAAPNDWEKAHHYLWRFWNAMPKAGHLTIFDRSWYGRVLVERVEGFCREDQWRRAYQEINEMEKQLVDFGCILIKFWLHIDKEEQLKRFQERQNSLDKQWKITQEDWRNRENWDFYKEAIDEMLFRTSTTYAPWTIVESNSKYYARIKTLRTVIEQSEKFLS